MSNPKSTHNQPIENPIPHFKAIPWCAKLLADKSVVQVAVPDRTPIASTESALVRETLNTPNTVKVSILQSLSFFLNPKSLNPPLPAGTPNTFPTTRSPLQSFRHAEKRNGANESLHTGMYNLPPLHQVLRRRNGPKTGEERKNPFLQVCALVDLASGINGYAKTAHGGFFGVVLDEVMGTAANMQAGIFPFPFAALFSCFFFRVLRGARGVSADDL